jgi:hypothetical protein
MLRRVGRYTASAPTTSELFPGGAAGRPIGAPSSCA